MHRSTLAPFLAQLNVSLKKKKLSALLFVFTLFSNDGYFLDTCKVSRRYFEELQTIFYCWEDIITSR